MKDLKEIFEKYADSDTTYHRCLYFEDFEQAIAEYEQSKWVSVEDRLPEIEGNEEFPYASERILIYAHKWGDPSSVYTVTGYYEKTPHDDGVFCDTEGNEIETATHWQPIPTPPKP